MRVKRAIPCALLFRFLEIQSTRKEEEATQIQTKKKDRSIYIYTIPYRQYKIKINFYFQYLLQYIYNIKIYIYNLLIIRYLCFEVNFVELLK